MSAERDLWGWFTPWTNNDHRKHQILDAIFKGVEKRGVTLSIGEYSQVHFESPRSSSARLATAPFPSSPFFEQNFAKARGDIAAMLEQAVQGVIDTAS